MSHAVAEVRLPPPPALPASAALYLDFDGTLAPIAVRPDAVQLLPEVPALLRELHHRLDGAVAIVTGRRLADVDARLAPFTFAGAGLHGAELRSRPDGPIHLQWRPQTGGLLEALRLRFGNDPRVLIEDKQASVALHYRQAPERAQECRAAMLELVPRREFEIIQGSMVVEARPLGAGKGRALQALAREAPFRGRVPVFVGDDVTDEDAFTAAAELGGWGVKVGAGTTVARYRLETIDALPGWLRGRR